MNIKSILIVVVALIVGGAIGFFAGTKTQQSRFPQFALNGNGGNFAGRFPGNGQNRVGGNGQGFRPVAGEIISSDDKSITVKLTDGSSKIILYSGSTSINKASQGSKSDLSNGTKVAVFGTTNSDGSVTAQSIQINPILRGPENTSPSPSPAGI